jgi:glycosyltransferase involved in cell wall biosynthesis
MIAFDLQALQSIGNAERGIARYVTELARALAAGPGRDLVDVYLWNDRYPYASRLDELGLGDKLQPFSAMRGRDVDVLHVNSPFEVPHLTDLLPPVRARRIVVTGYDLIPFLFPQYYVEHGQSNAYYRRRLGLLASADAVVTDSESAKVDIARFLGVPERRITVLGAGVGSQFAPPVAPLDERIAALRAAIPGLAAHYVLVPTAADWRKNSIGAIEAFGRLPAALRDRYQLVLFCKLVEAQRRALERAADRAGVADRVVITGYVPDDLLVQLYQSAELVMFATFYEGFGLPVLEARRCGARVICSDSSSLPEVLPDPAARFDPFVTDDIAATLERALTDVGFAAELDRVPIPPFTWELAAERLAAVYRGLQAGLPAPLARPHGAPRRVALVGALPFDGAPEAMANLALVKALDAIEDVELSVYVPGWRPTFASQCPCPGYHVSALSNDWQCGAIDDVVYLLGDDVPPAVARMAQLVPGHVLLHGDLPVPLDDRALRRFVRRGTDAERAYALDPAAVVLDWDDRDDATAAATQLAATLQATPTHP